MPLQTDQPWVSGSLEVLQHGFDLLSADTSSSRRLALIAVDNAVELAIRTFLELPRRVTGLHVPRKRLAENEGSFPALLDLLEEFAADRIAGLDLGSIEWYHRLRNQLYHQGHGLSVEREKVEVYAQIANLLFENLFGAEPIGPRSPAADLLGEFIALWPRLEAALTYVAGDHTLLGDRMPLTRALQFLRQADVIPVHEFREIERLRRLRNELVHGVSDFRQTLLAGDVEQLRSLVEGFEQVTGTGPKSGGRQHS